MSVPELLVLAPLRTEARALRGGLRGTGTDRWAVRRTGMGPHRSQRAAASVRAGPDVAVAVAGFCGALDPRLQVGDVVVATRLDGPSGAVPCPWAEPLPAALAARGLRVWPAPIAAAARPVLGRARAAAAEAGAVAVDMESAWLAPAAGERPFAVVRVVLDAPGAELLRPTLPRALRTAARTLATAAPALLDWAAACAARSPPGPGRTTSSPIPTLPER